MESMVREEILCKVCSFVCKDAVETSCCGTLFSAECVSERKQPRTCPVIPLQVNPNKSMRRIIDGMNVMCSMCKCVVHRSLFVEHAKVCPLRDFVCTLSDCQFKGVKEDFWDHLITVHESEVLSMTSNAPSDLVGCQPTIVELTNDKIGRRSYIDWICHQQHLMSVKVLTLLL